MTGAKMNEFDFSNNYAVDCENCVGLCCVAPKTTKSDLFPFDKAAGKPCDFLDENNQCTVYSELETRQHHGCIAYSCYGAGQNLTRFLQLDQDGKSWRDSPDIADAAFEQYFNLRNMLECVVKLSSTGVQTGNLMVLEYATILKDQIKDMSSLPDKNDVEGFMHVTQVMLNEVARNPEVTLTDLTSE